MDLSFKYEETKKDLIRRIRENDARITIRDGAQLDSRGLGSSCYFCLRPITGDVYRVEILDKKSQRGYNIDPDCFHASWGILE